MLHLCRACSKSSPTWSELILRQKSDPRSVFLFLFLLLLLKIENFILAFRKIFQISSQGDARLSRLSQTFTKNLMPPLQNLTSMQIVPDIIARAPPKIHRSLKFSLSCESKIAPPPGPAASTPKPANARPMPIRVPILELSSVSATNIAGGRATKTRVKNPSSNAVVTMPPTETTNVSQKRSTPKIKAPELC
jgi:hypothetical protein